MRYRKTRDFYVIQQYTGPQYGWEDVTEEDNRKDARAQLKTYRENQPEYPARIKLRRERIKHVEALDGLDASEFDVAGMLCDIRNGNFSPERVEDYRHENQVRDSLINGQFSQARQQCQSCGLNYEAERLKFEHETATA